MTDWQTHSRVVESHAVPGEGRSSGSTFHVTYTASVRSHRDQYKKNIWEIHCRWGYQGLTLRRSLTLVTGGQDQLLDQAEYAGHIPFENDSTKENCQHILENSIIPAVDVMTNRQFWSNLIDEDEETVRQYIRNYDI